MLPSTRFIKSGSLSTHLLSPSFRTQTIDNNL
jgi:hypothetical protein